VIFDKEFNLTCLTLSLSPLAMSLLFHNLCIVPFCACAMRYFWALVVELDADMAAHESRLKFSNPGSRETATANPISAPSI
jgi:hypothetical protein